MPRGLLTRERRKSVERMVPRQLDGDRNQVRQLQYCGRLGGVGAISGPGFRVGGVAGDAVVDGGWAMRVSGGGEATGSAGRRPGWDPVSG